VRIDVRFGRAARSVAGRARPALVGSPANHGRGGVDALIVGSFQGRERLESYLIDDFPWNTLD